MGDFPSQCLFQVKDTGAGLDRKLDIAGAARRPHQESVFMPQQKQRSCGVSSPQEGDSAEPIPREDSGDFPSRHLILLKDTEAGLGRKQACLSQREDSGDSPNQHLIPLKNTEAGLAHPRERTLETSLTGISSRSKTQKLASSIPREDSGDFPNRHLILLKDTEAGLAHRTERTVEASQTGISSCSKTRELAWPILEKRQWRLPKLASYPAQTPFQHTGAGLGDLISMAAIPGRPRSPQEHRCSPAGTAVISVTGDLISVAAIPGGPRSPQEHRCSPAGTAVISVTGRIYSCCDRSRGPAVSAALRKETVLRCITHQACLPRPGARCILLGHNPSLETTTRPKTKCGGAGPKHLGHPPLPSPGHSRELDWKRSNRDRIQRPYGMPAPQTED
ncbi:uncharacterized protein LOC133753512 isoform X2 [Lepus europaeus]|uniref:uncharacterized protein LOC133753512 isoform X2 n=1 Tax=Lepus europaeus TaxID=9983 RepID=UPI002B4A4057|nr:uncharacterized protein LOC133753512 isoform X2 [Lepus europaeus]